MRPYALLEPATSAAPATPEDVPAVTREPLFEQIAQALLARNPGHPLRVAVDGIDAAGKTTFANTLAGALARSGRSIIRVSVDDFQHSRRDRTRRGLLSPEGYYEDAFNYKALIEQVLAPLGPGGTLHYHTAVFDHRADEPLGTPEQLAAPDALALVDGVFLLRKELWPYWDASIWLDIPFELALERALVRDAERFGTPEAVRERYSQRYLPAQRLYLNQAHPRDRAEFLVDNSDPANPVLVSTDE